MAAPRPRRRALAAAEEIEYDRVLFFSDAVFAAANWLYTIHWILLRILVGPAVFLLSIPVAIGQPVLVRAQYLWLLALVSALVLRRVEPPEVDSTITEGDDDPHG
jgi:hypothetical protein